MECRKRCIWRAVVMAVVLVGWAVVAMTSVAAADDDDRHPRIFPRDAVPYGNTLRGMDRALVAMAACDPYRQEPESRHHGERL